MNKCLNIHMKAINQLLVWMGADEHSLRPVLMRWGKCVCIQICVLLLLIIMSACDKPISPIRSVSTATIPTCNNDFSYEKEHLFITIMTRPYLINIKNTLVTPKNGAQIKRWELFMYCLFGAFCSPHSLICWVALRLIFALHFWSLSHHNDRFRIVCRCIGHSLPSPFTTLMHQICRHSHL